MIRAALLAVLVTLATAAPAAATHEPAAAPETEPGAAPLAPRAKALLLLRVLAYDRALSKRAGDEAVVVIAFRAGPEPQREQEVLRRTFQELSTEVVVAGRTVRVISLPLDGEEDLPARLAAASPSVVYLAGGRPEDAAALSRAARRVRVLSACGTRAGIAAGLAIGLVPRGARAGVLVNLAGARAEGADLDPALLHLAEVVPDSDPGPAD